MPVPRISHIVSLGTDLKERARRYDRAISVLEGLSTALAAIFMAIGGFFNEAQAIGLPFLIAGAVACILSISLVILRQRGALEHVAHALAATTEADVCGSEAMALRAKASGEVIELRRERDDAVARAHDTEEGNRIMAAEAGKAAQRVEKAKTRLARLNSRVGELGNSLHRERRLVESQRTHRKRMLLAFTSMHDAAESCAPDMPLREVVEAILDAAYHDIIGALGCEADEKWTLSIYSRETVDGDDFMMRAFARSWDRKEQFDRRAWARGEGYTGEAWRRGERPRGWEGPDDVIEGDTRDPLVATSYSVPESKFQPADVDLYVSVAAVPIKMPGAKPDRAQICGVVIATSDRVGRFLRNPSLPLAQNADFVHQLERIIAVQVALRRDASKGAFKHS